ncbi:coxsackievirus and adenovirus receptor homolog isoform X2 [Hypanus sabinus]|uniref:coxsackievirus and adenovirus receptor homolog isoform X2 n=1 Tax=Hypanus sabinus TaxID=79690 RepID=UPI0028C3951A|nr:coxsackievirus and adenovirus receptor homolog isoform X2 [Hypanus sabinus]
MGFGSCFRSKVSSSMLLLIQVLCLSALVHDVQPEGTSTTRANCGSTTVLACPFTGEGEGMRVTWQKKKPLLVVYVSHGVPSSQYRNRTTMQLGWSKTGAANLTIHDLRVTDSGTYECNIRLNPKTKSEIYSTVTLEVDPGERDVWANSTEVTVKAGENLTLHFSHNLKCFTSNLHLTWKQDRNLVAFMSVGQERQVKQNLGVSANYINGNATLLLQNITPSQAGNYTCCFKDYASTEERCAVINVVITENWSGAESTLIHNHSMLTLLLVVLFSCVMTLC